jgi:hypothetical protein
MRRELHHFIDVIPERSFGLVRDILSYLAESPAATDEPLVIEPADENEITLIKEGMKEYEKNPASFISLAEYAKRKKCEPVCFQNEGS